MPAHNSSGQKPETRFARILAAICQHNGGELRIKGADIDSIDKDLTLVLDWDSSTQELVVRSGTRFLEPYRINAEAAAPWQTQTTTAPVTPAHSPTAPPLPTPPASSVPDNARLSNMERNQLKRRVAGLLRLEQEARDRQEAELLRRAGVPLSSSDS